MSRHVRVTLPSGQTLLAGTEDIKSSIEFPNKLVFDDTPIIVVSSMYENETASPYAITKRTKYGFEALSRSDSEVRFSWMALGWMNRRSLVKPPISEGVGIFADRYQKINPVEEVQFGPGNSYIISPDPIVIVTPEFDNPVQHNDTVRNVDYTKFYVSSKNKTSYIHWIAMGLVEKGAEGRPIKMTLSGGETLLAGSQIKKNKHDGILFPPGLFERTPIVVITPRLTDNTLPGDGIPNTDAIVAANTKGFSIMGLSFPHTINWIALAK